MAKSKIISFRVPYTDYAQVLITCSKTNTDISDFARDKFYFDSQTVENEKQELQKENERLTGELNLATIGFEQSIKDLSKKEDRIQELEKEQERLTKELSDYATTSQGILTEYESQSKKYKELEKAKNKAESDLKAELSQKDEKLSEALKKIETLEKRLINANNYCIENGIGTGIFGTNEAVQF